MSTTPWRRLGLRREVTIFLPLVLLLLVVISTFTLLAYRNALDLLAGERRLEAVRMAREVARNLPAGPVPSAQELRRLAPGARWVAILDSEGRPLALSGEAPPTPPLAPLDSREIGTGTGAGPDAGTGERAAGFALAGEPGQRRIVRVDLPAARLAAQRRSFRILSAVVVPIDVLITLLLLLFLRHLLRPYESLLARARALGQEPAESDDEAAFLLETFERATAALARRDGPSPEDDFATLQRTLAPSLESGLLLLTRGGEVLTLNAFGAELLGIAPPSPGAPLEEVLADHPALFAILRQAVGEQQTVQRREVETSTPGGPRTLGLTVHPLRHRDGSARGYLALFADLTEVQRQAKEERLVESLAQLGELAAGVAHELRNSLATLRGYLELIERHPAEEAARDEYLAEIRLESDRLQRVVEDFLSFTRPGTARLEELDLEAVVRRAAADPALAGTEVAVRVERGAGLAMRGDTQLLERALRNLLHNAAEAGREAGRDPRIEVSVARLEEGGEVVVADRGPGLPPEVRERLFQPFVSRRPGGTGLGLATAHRIVSLHRGRLHLEDRPGGGTRAVLSFPADAFTDAAVP